MRIRGCLAPNKGILERDVMAKRTYIFTLRAVARSMCKYILLAKPILQKQYPSNTALLLALEVAAEACDTLFKELDELYVIGA